MFQGFYDSTSIIIILSDISELNNDLYCYILLHVKLLSCLTEFNLKMCASPDSLPYNTYLYTAIGFYQLYFLVPHYCLTIFTHFW